MLLIFLQFLFHRCLMSENKKSQKSVENCGKIVKVKRISDQASPRARNVKFSVFAKNLFCKCFTFDFSSFKLLPKFLERCSWLYALYNLEKLCEDSYQLHVLLFVRNTLIQSSFLRTKLRISDFVIYYFTYWFRFRANNHFSKKKLPKFT